MGSNQRTIALIFLIASAALGQAYRVDPTPAMTTAGTAPSGAYPPLYAVPGAVIAVCTYPSCSAPAATYTDASAANACPSTDPVVLAGTSTCGHVADARGNFGWWTALPLEMYTVTIGSYIYGPFPVSSNASTGSGASSNTNVMQYGAKCDGATNDTAAIQAAINASLYIYIPQACAVVPPVGIGGALILSVPAGEWIDGPGTIKVANAVGNYSAIFQCANTGCDEAKFTRFTIDSNIANNPITDQATILAHPRIELALNGSRITVDGVTIKNSSAVQNIYIGSMGLNTVVNNTLISLGDDPNHVGHDISTIYLGPMVGSSGGDVVANNKSSASSFAAPAAEQGSCYEVHGSYWTVTGNTCWGFGNGLNFTGIDYQDDIGSTATGNSFVTVTTGILVWSLQYSTHTSGYGLNGATITGNNLTIHQVGHDNPWYGGTTGGIAQYAGNNLPLTGLNIQGNTVVYDLETSSRTTTFASVGIGMPIGLTAATSTNGIIANNIILNAPTTAIALSGAAQNWTIGPNLIRNAGASQDVTVGAGYKIPLWLDLTAGAGNIKVVNTGPVDDLSTSVMEHAFALACAATAHGIEFLDNDPRISGATKTSWISYFQQYDNNCDPFVRMTVEDEPWTNPVGDSMKAGSTIYDGTVPIGYTLYADGATFARTDALQGASINVTGNAVLGGQTFMNGATAGGYFFGSSAHQSALLVSPADNVVQVRNTADSADAAIDAGNATFSGNLTDTVGFTTLSGAQVNGLFINYAATNLAELAWNPDRSAVRCWVPSSGDPGSDCPVSVSDVLVSNGLVMKDTATGTCYRVKITSAALALTSITCPTGF